MSQAVSSTARLFEPFPASRGSSSRRAGGSSGPDPRTSVRDSSPCASPGNREQKRLRSRRRQRWRSRVSGLPKPRPNKPRSPASGVRSPAREADPAPLSTARASCASRSRPATTRRDGPGPPAGPGIGGQVARGSCVPVNGDFRCQARGSTPTLLSCSSRSNTPVRLWSEIREMRQGEPKTLGVNGVGRAGGLDRRNRRARDSMREPRQSLVPRGTTVAGKSLSIRTLARGVAAAPRDT